MYMWYAFGYAFARVCGVYANAHCTLACVWRSDVDIRCLVSFWIVLHLTC